VADQLRFRTDLFRGTAPFYDRFRAPYPEELLDDLRQRLPVSGRGRLLDLASGTGQIAFPLACYFDEVVAVDQEPQSVEFAKAKAEAAGVSNITWVSGAAESVALDGPFELVAVGNAFHRLNRQLVAERMRSWLQPGGGVALLWGGTPGLGDQPWEQAMAKLLESWRAKLGATDRIPAGWEAVMDRDPHERVLGRAGLDYVGDFMFSVHQTWTPETLAGFVYSSSGLNRMVLGDHVADFERDLSEQLLPHATSGTFDLLASYRYQLALKPS
jgi:SAM-dependent methyltransferase